MFTDACVYMERHCRVERQVQPEARLYDLENGEYIRVVNSLVGVRLYFVIDTGKYAKLNINQAGPRLRIADDTNVYFDVLNMEGGRKKRLLFRARDMETREMVQVLRAVLKLFPEHSRYKTV